MANTYYICLKYRNLFNLHDTLSFPGPIFIDSGGFQHSLNSNLPRTSTVQRQSPQDVLAAQVELGADFAASLDYPLDPGASYKENLKRVEGTLRNVEVALRTAANFLSLGKTMIVPVLHGYTGEMLRYSVKRLEELEEEYSYKFSMYGVGSLVPLYADRSGGAPEKLVGMFAALRRLVPDCKLLHVFGAGSPFSMRLFFLLGADSLDTRSWVTNAWFGKIVLPHNGRVKVKDLIKRHGPKAKICKCPICMQGTLRDLQLSRMKRSAHNAYVYIREFRSILREIREGSFEEKTLQILSESSYFRRYAKYVS